MPTRSPLGQPGASGETAGESMRQQEILSDFGRLASQTIELNALCQLACVQVARAVGVRHSKVLLYRPTLGDLLMIAGFGWQPDVVGHVTMGTDVASAAGRTLKSGRPLWVDDLPNHPEFRYPPVLRRHGIVSVLNVPVNVGGAPWGVLEVDSDQPRRFGHEDVMFLSGIANILGLAVHGNTREGRASERADRAARDVEHQKTLLRELVHRYKNDFQMITSILLVQMQRQRDADAAEGFRVAFDRVSAIATVHDQLAIPREIGTVEIGAYILALCGNLGHRNEQITIDTRLDTAVLSHRTAVSLGLITNELVTNAIKHAFPERGGTVLVEFAVEGDGAIGCLTVSDDGAGMAVARAGGSGLDLVKGLAQQIGGTVEQERPARGTKFLVRFPIVS